MNFIQFFKNLKNDRKKIASYGLDEFFFVRYRSWVSIFSIVIAGITLGLLVQLLPQAMSGVEVTALVIASGAFILGYQQWREARNEISLDKYYERLELANRRLEDWPAAREIVEHFWPDNKGNEPYFQRAMYVYVELDNLEYVIEKYKLGYMSSEQTLRGLRIFRGRCKSKQFRDLAFEYVQIPGYQPTTINAVKRVFNDQNNIAKTVIHCSSKPAQRKQPPILHLDDILEWYRAQERDYQKKINALLRTYMEADEG